MPETTLAQTPNRDIALQGLTRATATSEDLLRYPWTPITYHRVSPHDWIAAWSTLGRPDATQQVETIPAFSPRGVRTVTPATWTAIDLLLAAHPGNTFEFLRDVFDTKDVLGDPRRFVLAEEDLERSLGTSPVLDVPPKHSSVRERLGELLGWTRLSPAELAPLVGARRRTIYNWLADGAIGRSAEERILQLHAILEPLARTHDPLLIRAWLARGDPNPADLASAEKWVRLKAGVRKELQPLVPAEAVIHPSPYEDDAQTPAARRAALLAFASPPARAPQPRAGWRPREATGIEADATDD